MAKYNKRNNQNSISFFPCSFWSDSGRPAHSFGTGRSARSGTPQQPRGSAPDPKVRVVKKALNCLSQLCEFSLLKYN